MPNDRHANAESRLKAAMDQLLAGDIPEGLRCDIKSLSILAAVPRATLYRTYPHVKEEFENRLGAAREATGEPDPRLAQIDRLKAEVSSLKGRLSRMKEEASEASEFKTLALSRLAEQHDEIQRLRAALQDSGNVRTLPVRARIAADR
ncbi:MULTISPECIES: hypothetical protein [Streptomyces]|uniref:hypothetical protein n=1 Tax=Streptomyces TaxID=1883 RepID=UPI00017EAAC8|nr:MULTISPECIES: hypothetical protein [Streptomyces]AKL65383.1 hypothetical protein M444_08235 [Streptomyces sp. Mg1]EDX26324.1 conserved hypothetical protein [Streptomyces sp. Mg1]WBY19364.1 hypothetical protein PET44_06825 [Streptomyces goshikiensis]